MKSIVKKVSIIIIISIVLVFITVLSYHLYKNSRTTMPTSHIYVSDNPNHKSDFDKWITKDLKVSWVPSYIIINNKKVIGVINGGISEKDLTSKIGTCLALNYEYSDLTSLEITNLNGDRKPLSDIISNTGLNILEISWYGCKDCEYQDKNFTNDVYYKYSTKIIYRYYINSKVKDVEKLYSRE